MHVDSDLAPRVDLDEVIADLVGDLKELRAGALSVKDARARAALAREVMRGFRLVIEARKFLAMNAKPIREIGSGADPEPPKRRGRGSS